MSASLTKAKFDRMRTQLKNLRAQGQEVTRKGTHAVMGVAGGAAAGALAVKMPLVPNTEIPSDAAVGGVAVLAALANAGGNYDDALLSFGTGMLAASASRAVARQMAG